MSPRTENSFLEPDVPVTPAKHSPDDTPMMQYVSLIFLRALMMLKPVKSARYASLPCAIGKSPQMQIMVLPLSSITSLLMEPSWR